jgi:DNA polymerase III subunit alpha
MLEQEKTQLASYAALRVRSEYSLVDSTIRLEELIKQAKAFGLPAIALTDELNLFALVKFFKQAESAGIKPIVGADCWLRDEPAAGSASGITGTGRTRFTLLCQNRAGYLNLCRLLSRAWIERTKAEEPAISWAWLEQAHEGLIVLVGFGSNVAQALGAGQLALARTRMARWAALFEERCYIELSRCGRTGENALVEPFAELSVSLALPCVATNEAVFLQASAELASDADMSEFTAHEARVCISEGYVMSDASRVRRHSAEQSLLSVLQMAARFADVPVALENTLELAKRCNVSLSLGTYFLPNFPTPAGSTADEFLALEAHAGLAERLAKLEKLGQLATTRELYGERLTLELGVILRMGFAGYFLIVSEFIRWAKSNGIPVGPGRGSGAGSLVAYVLSITDIDPIRYELLFERFLNPERVSMPDFDIDFCMDRRDEVIQHVSDLYGSEKVCQIITYGTMAAKACIRDAGRVLGMGYGHTDSIAKLIPPTLGIELSDALKESAELRAALERDEDARNLMRLALKLEGLTRNAGKHAGGVVIAPSALTDFSPLYSEGTDPDSVGELAVTQFDKDDVEAIGLVKFDFLGLRTLTIIDWALKAINQRRLLEHQSGAPPNDLDFAPLDMSEVALDDERTFALLCSGRTTAVFQLESRGMKELARKLKPNTFEDIIALGALFRPGPLQSGMVDEFVERKHGRRETTYAHPSLEPVLKPTYGVIVYQEQVMQIAQVLAGYTLGGADMLRRAMGKKKAEEMAQQRAIFAEGAGRNAVDAQIASATFDLMEKFAEYGFNKSHSAAYAMVTYHTAYLKAYYPAEFMSAVLSSESDNTDKIVDFLADAREFGLRVLAPDIQHSQTQFAAQEGPLTIRYGLGAVKGVGAAVCAEIVRQRADAPYKDLSDFVQRVSAARPNRRVLEALIDSGALDSLAPHRAILHANLADALKASEKMLRDSQAGQFDMFGSALMQVQPSSILVQVPEFGVLEKLNREKAVLGGYFSGHPLDEMRAELAELGCLRFADIAARTQPKPETKRTAEQPAIVAGEVEAIRRRGDSMAFAKLADGTGASLEAGFFKDAMARYPQLLKDGERIVVAGGLSWDGFSSNWQLKVRHAYPIEEALNKACREIKLTVSGAGQSFVGNLKALLASHTGGQARVRIALEFDEGGLELELGAAWRVRGTLALKAALQKLGGVRAVHLSFNAALLSEEGPSYGDESEFSRAASRSDSAPPWAA